MATQIQLRRDTAANWTSINPVLLMGELGYETDTNKFKVGDGTTVWNSVRYAIVIDNAAQTLTNKTISGATNTLTNIANASLSNSSISVNGQSVSLGTNIPVGSWTSTAVSSNITLARNNSYFVTTSAARTLTLPASPAQGDEIRIFDGSGSAATNNITVLANGSKIKAVTQDLTIDVNNAAVTLVYISTAYGWSVV
jgi:hypothetical protein